VTSAIMAEARRQLADVGPAALSLRAVARGVGMVSSGVYRYFASRDELLTALIVESYDALGDVAEQAAKRRARTPLDRWVTACRAVRRWAVEHPHQYALVYGTPVPGYRAPEGTIVPAQRVARALAGIAVDAARDGQLAPPAAIGITMGPRLRKDLSGIIEDLSVPLSEEDMVRLLVAWTQVFGLITFELFGQTRNAVHAHAGLFDATVTTTGCLVGLVGR